MADQGVDSLMREYRKGNWTVGETMILIEAKKMEDERRMRKNEEREGRSSKATESRWKWVEHYCWIRGCLRSQNQCNDKWDNLMRDYKKVRDFERGEGNGGLYWNMEKKDRKERNLPANTLFQVYEALVQVVEKKAGLSTRTVTCEVDHRPLPLLPPVAALPPQLPPPPPPPLAFPPPPLALGGYHLLPPPLQYAQPFPTVGMRDSSDTNISEHSDTPSKRMRRSMEEEEEETAISKSAAVIVEALQACEERKERRHRDRLSLQERKLKIEESKTLIHREGISGLAEAINKLANFISALASHKIQPSSSK